MENDLLISVWVLVKPLQMPARSTKLVFVWDWDDSFLATHAIALEALRQKAPITEIEQSPALKVKLRALEASVINVITAFQRYGTIYVVTNSETGWVLLTCIKFLPNLLPYFHGPSAIPVISALDLYKKRSMLKFEGSSGADWKYFAMCRILQLEALHDVFLFSIGDSDAEREAAARIRAEMTAPLAKLNPYKSPIKVRSLKMLEQPTIDQLIQQLDRLRGIIGYLIYTIKQDDITLALPKPQPPKSAPRAA
ncbi:Hypothetical protein POVN_LOCUS493 [uncultured virus]|nr:Hypothetical protein POVN_LOCUS493 [uncultured virus]